MYSWRVAGSCSHEPTLKRVAFWRLTLDGAIDPQKGYRLLVVLASVGEPTGSAKVPP
jgi:hypothetical protein